MNIKNALGIIQNYSAYQEPGKSDQFSRERTINRCQPQGESDVRIIKVFKAAR